MAADAQSGGPAVCTALMGGPFSTPQCVVAADSILCVMPSCKHAHSHLVPLSQFNTYHSTAVPSRQPGTQILLWSCSDVLVIGSGSSLPGLEVLQHA